MVAEKSVPEKRISEFVERLKQAAGENLESVVLYGSAVRGDYEPDYSNINLMVFLKETSLAKLLALAPVVEEWVGKKHRAPLLITRDEMERSADVFAIELMDMKSQHRVLFGPDFVASLQIPMHLHRAQLEYELREKLILLRQRLLVDSRDEARTWHLLLRSLPAFATLFRHALIALGDASPAARRDAVQALSTRVGFDPTALNQVLDVREHKAASKKIDINDLVARYLAAIEKVTAAVDEALDSDASGRA